MIVYEESFTAGVEALVTFDKLLIGPELVSRKTENLAQSQSTEFFCYSQQPPKEGEYTVGCDNPDCRFNWIHFECAKIKTCPRSKKN